MVSAAEHPEWKRGEQIYLRERDAPWRVDEVYKDTGAFVRLSRVEPDGGVGRLRVRIEVLRAYMRAISRPQPERGVQGEFGYRLRATRVGRDISQSELAPLAGLHWTALGHIEAGRRNTSLRVLYDLADALDVAPSELLP
ncbi:helix-turn-helix domain-containing protein [Jiangella alba]|uniref:DNA-binding transcriptional regulator, XRE-family HTH domain n=1 Tax=Jiangella alba TaxID=561176 RepID=A0A1H5J7Y9_9ACTN|nr:helix-turn-helix transcriptional regulator [Jiangella alba]SEE48530.1 DNA-binding transcriptional regulator, XRE-family HTH domain [Jiangella alba]